MNYRSHGKRLFDVMVTAPALVVLGAPMAALGFTIRQKLGSPVLFRHRRPGKDGKPFVLLKFRTMTDERDSNGALLPDDQRLTPFGAWLRKTSLDELPSLLNVLRGEMSLVGPRPLLMEYLERYSPEQARRHEVRPGITGLAQVHGRNALSWETKFEDDVFYVDHCSFIFDLQILLKTVVKVWKAEDVNHPGHVTMPNFDPKRTAVSTPSANAIGNATLGAS